MVYFSFSLVRMHLCWSIRSAIFCRSKRLHIGNFIVIQFNLINFMLILFLDVSPVLSTVRPQYTGRMKETRILSYNTQRLTQTFQSLVDFPQVFLGVSKCVWSGCIPGQSCWLLPSAVVGYLQLCHHLHCAKTLIPRLGGNRVGDPSRYWLGLPSARLAAFCFGWAETLSLGANPCQWLWPPVLSLLMCWWLRSWLQVQREPLLPSAILSGLSKNAWVTKS